MVADLGPQGKVADGAQISLLPCRTKRDDHLD